jgi:cysteinyl-tRNA synthetase
MADEKMSKSLGNVIIPHDLLKTVPGEVLRWALLAAHYRQPLDWTAELIEQSRKALDRLYGALQRVKGLDVEPRSAGGLPRSPVGRPEHAQGLRRAVRLAKTLETAHGDGKAAAKADLLAAANLLGFLKADPDVWFAGGADEELKGKVEALLEARG